MKYFLLLVQERGVKIPAPVWEVVALAAAAAPPPPCLSVVLQRMLDCETRSFASKLPPSDMSYFRTCSRIFHTLAQQISAEFLTTAPLLFATYTQKDKYKHMFPKETQPRVNEGESRCFFLRGVF